MVLHMEYVRLESVAVKLDCSISDLIHLGAIGKLPVYTLADNWCVNLFAVSETDEINSHGYPALTEGVVQPRSMKPNHVTDPVQLYPETLRRFEANPDTTEYRFIAPFPDDNDKFDSFEYQIWDESLGCASAGKALANMKLVVMAVELEKLRQQVGAEDSKYEKPKRKAPDKFVAALIKLLVEIAIRATKKGLDFDISKMPGIKKDLQKVAEKFPDGELDGKTPQTFDDYLQGFCQFGQGSNSSDFYRKLFPEYFE